MATTPPSSARNSPDTPQPLGAVIEQVRGWVERCGWIWVTGQVIELRRRQAATQFLTLRDSRAENSATITCSTQVLDAAGPLTEGMTVVACLTPRVWTKTTRLSFECSELRIAGEGQLLVQLEQLKRKLQAEGLFDPVRKKRLPFLPRRIGLVTGANSAAERDVLANLRKRWPGVQVQVRHALVQGPDSASDVMAGLAELDADAAIELIIIARGGGSLEDLLPFSNEGLVRAVAAARTPVISAIGHEPDSPILDLVADRRASTPTEAAKIAVPDAREQSEQLAVQLSRLRQAIITRVRNEQDWLTQLVSRPVLRDPSGSFASHQEWLDGYRHRLGRAIDQQLGNERTALAHAVTRIRSMSPKATLERGYAIVADAEGGSVTSVNDADPGDQLLLYLSDGQLFVEVDYQEEDS
ncbi:exodeoxyribonuclease VII large subunit [Propionimicrobium sp. PCR01-08-3]|uniref:exodeoxyribonuclease VII large subunit n=1 Tax=Propionimicrobium sp. PCR01-08-3 TaxID=3052086 RepID=UPI00255C698E|nr:exodeoxyribonuclease VII large subunit [Propionimicrobium sp. PCR01-08-3]WIY81857.1 exodeoxyribonuclease VII large subunit [Propionimicrobium sp. PCR01-08-3]